MDRMDEYRTLLEEVSQPAPAALEGALERAKVRRKKRLLRPIQGILTGAAMFVLLVNFCAPVAHACAQLPILRELAEFVSFSQPLTQAVENEYAQIMDQKQSANGITAEIEYLIVDRKQVNIFYRVDGPEEEYYVESTLEQREGCSFGYSPITASGELSSLQAEYIDGPVPEALTVCIQVFRQPGEREDAPQNVHSSEALEEPEREKLAEFFFDLTFDPAFMAPARLGTVEGAFEADGQRFSVDRFEVYPTGIRFHVLADEGNTMWLAGLDFYLETEEGERLDSVSNGISASGEEGSPAMVNYFADSSYFYDSGELTLVITGVELRQKEKHLLPLDQSTGAVEGTLPEGITVTETERRKESLTITLYYPEERLSASVLDRLWDETGGEIPRSSLSTTNDWENGGCEETHYYPACPEGEVYLELRYDTYRETEIPLTITMEE